MEESSQTSPPPDKAGLLKHASGLKTFAIVAGLILILSFIRLAPGQFAGRNVTDNIGEDTVQSNQVQEVGPDPESTVNTTNQNQATDPNNPNQPDKKTANLECKAGRNGGVTEKGVGITSTRIRLATTAVLDGPAKSLLSDSVTGMKSVMDKINRSGGICGRLLDLKVDNDSFNGTIGLQYIKNYIEDRQGFFALPVVPSAEGLGSAILSKDISRSGIPVIGTDGMRQEQYSDPWVWPVATATRSTMRIMASFGKTIKGAGTFAIVWDSKYKFGVEGRDAFRDQVDKMGATLVWDQPLDPDKPSYSSEAETFNTKCSDGKCDMVAMLLLPEAAAKWMARKPVKGRLYTSAAQTLFTDRFAQDCVQAAKEECHGFAVWTGYNPPIGALASKSGVAAYVNDVKALNPGIDVNNQFLQGSYLGMNVFIEALKKASPNLTRARIKEVMDSMDYRTDLTSTLSWRPDKHTANSRAQSFSIVVSQGTFNGWRNEQTGFVQDPEFGG